MSVSGDAGWESEFSDRSGGETPSLPVREKVSVSSGGGCVNWEGTALKKGEWNMLQSPAN